MTAQFERGLTRFFLIATALAGAGQIWWFARTSFRMIDYDALSYVGVATHLRHGEFYAAINAFRSPLISWLIAAGSFTGANPLLLGKVINIVTFLISLVLVYALTKQLWSSPLVASIASLWFSLSRGIAATAVLLVSPDLLLTVLVLFYFLLLLRCLRTGSAKNWFWLGGLHGLAYLAKAFALPWLALTSAVAAALSAGGNKRLAQAAVLPLFCAALWAGILYSKYGVITTGSQFKANFIGYNAPDFRQKSPRFSVLLDTSPEAAAGDPSFLKMDAVLANDPMPPHSRAWSYSAPIAQELRLDFDAERRNIPGALKEMTVLLTPGGILAFAIALGIVVKRRSEMSKEFRFIVVISVAGVSLILAYCLLVFLTTYAFPLTAVVIAVGARSFVDDLDLALHCPRPRTVRGMIRVREPSRVVEKSEIKEKIAGV